MIEGGYEIIHYRPEFRYQVVDILQYLLGNNYEENSAYFKWKYESNPYTEYPLGIVATRDGKVAGFRGYFVTRWQVDGKNNEILFLCPGDTCVHPDHRMKGLSVAMGTMAMELYAGNYRILLNTTATKKSFPGYQKMEFFPLAKKSYLSKYNLFGLTKAIVSAHKHLPLNQNRIKLGEFEDIEVSDRPKPSEMIAVTNGQAPKFPRIKLFQDEEFFRWRFNNRKNKYIFYYCRKGNINTGYVILGVSPNNRRGYILDYSEKDNSALEKILRYIIVMKHFDVLSIYNFCLSEHLVDTLRKLRFSKNGLLRVLEKKVKGELPLLVRPVKRKYDASDLIIEGLDIRDIENWKIKGICSDDM